MPQGHRLAGRKRKGSIFRPLTCLPLGVLTCRSRGPRWEFAGQRVPPGSRKPEERTSARDAHLSPRPLGPAGSWVGARCPRLTPRDLFPRRRRRRERCPRRIRISELPPLPGMRALCPSREEVRRPVPRRVASARDAGGGGAGLGLHCRNFPGGPVAKTLSAQCRGLGSIPGQGTRSHMRQLRPWCSQ